MAQVVQYFGVDLKMSSPSKTWAGESEVEYSLEVENTGQQEETINLAVNEASGPGCSNTGAISVTLSDIISNCCTQRK